jgi:hypothetical protein
MPYRTESVMGNVVVAQWRGLRHELLRLRTEQLVGPPGNVDDEPALQLTITHLPLPDGGIRVTVDNACDLADVHDLCNRVAAACLDDDHRVVFNRAVAGQAG